MDDHRQRKDPIYIDGIDETWLDRHGRVLGFVIVASSVGAAVLTLIWVLGGFG